MLRDREIWLRAFCYWVICALLIGLFILRWIKDSAPVVTVIAVAMAFPASLAMAIYERRSEARDVQQRAALRVEGRFEEAAEWQSDAFYVGWSRYRLARAAVAGLLAMAGIVLLMPVLLFAGVAAAACDLWWAYRVRVAHRQEIEHRRTSKQRITAAEDALESSGWNRCGLAIHDTSRASHKAQTNRHDQHRLRGSSLALPHG